MVLDESCCPNSSEPTKHKHLSKKQRAAIAKAEFDKTITPEVLESAEQMHKRLSRISNEELHREFTV